jgi:hypothetical protein
LPDAVLLALLVQVQHVSFLDHPAAETDCHAVVYFAPNHLQSICRGLSGIRDFVIEHPDWRASIKSQIQVGTFHDHSDSSFSSGHHQCNAREIQCFKYTGHFISFIGLRVAMALGIWENPSQISSMAG